MECDVTLIFIFNIQNGFKLTFWIRKVIAKYLLNCIYDILYI